VLPVQPSNVSLVGEERDKEETAGLPVALVDLRHPQPFFKAEPRRFLLGSRVLSTPTQIYNSDIDAASYSIGS